MIPGFFAVSAARSSMKITGVVHGAANLESYSAELSVVGAETTVKWSLVGGSLPVGLHLVQTGSTTASIMGVADDDVGYYAVMIRAEDSNGRAVVREVEIGVGNIIALLHFDGANNATTMTDETGRSWSVSGDAKLSTADPVFGSASLVLDGNGDFLTGANVGWDIGLQDFDISVFAKPVQLATTQRFWSKYSGANVPRIGFYYSGATGRVSLNHQANNTTPSSVVASASTLGAGTWQFCAASRRAGIAVAGIDGEFGEPAPMAMSWTVAGNAGIGRFINSVSPWEEFFTGGLDEFKLVVGARINVEGYVPSGPSDYPQPPPELAVIGSLPAGTEATPYSSTTDITIHGSAAPFAVSVSAGALPGDWAAIVNGDHVEVTGSGVAAGAYTFTLEIEDDDNNSAELPLTVVIE